ncbi:MAG TPA: hypothetical protein DCW74_18620 [Alteromonas australica]|uniref:Uncharacterized protein n=1 Tax=Alteromonas australica TaxID=589873 RepID=A0A350P8W9_9ALTE|nr:hypothetical protein [Alteromonas australica]
MMHAYWALEQSRYLTRAKSENIGVFASASINRYLHENLGGQLDANTENNVLIGNTIDFLATRVAFKLGLTGPAITLQTGCSSGLVALHQARIALLTKQCNMALVGAVSFSAPNDSGYEYEEGGIRSKNGDLRPFDKDATGTVFTNGVAVLLLKPYEEAKLDKDNILGVIAGSAINNDGDRKASFTAPNPRQQAAVIEKALRVAKADKKSVCLIEAHGTGTSLGDPIEFDALTQVIPKIDTPAYCALQSVKANVGHMDTVSGLAGIIKSALCLQNRELPPQTQFETVNPQINLQNSPFFINTQSQALPQSGTLYAGVTALGIGGTNAHVVMKTAEDGLQEQTTSTAMPIILCSAHDPDALVKQKNELVKFCQRKGNKLDLQKLAATTQFYRPAYPYRSAHHATSLDNLIQSLKRPAKVTNVKSPHNIAFLFPGQGSQYPDMAKTLYKNHAGFRNQLDHYFSILSLYNGTDYSSLIFSKDNDALYQTQHTQMALLAVEVALARYLIDLKVVPQVLIGHSLGEFSALVISEVLSFKSAAELIYHRATLMASTKPGQMLAVFAPLTKLKPLLGEHVNVAAENAPNLTTVSGTPEAIDAFTAKLHNSSIVSQPIPTHFGFHSYLLDDIKQDFLKVVEAVEFHSPKIPIVSNVTGQLHTIDSLRDPHYWVQQMRQAVMFQSGIQTIELQYQPAYVEVGPGTTLTTFCRQIVSRPSLVATHILPHPKHSAAQQETLLAALAELWQVGCNIDWSSIEDGTQKASYYDLPPYAFLEKRCWIEGRLIESCKSRGLNTYQKVWQQIIETPKELEDYQYVILHDDPITAHLFKHELNVAKESIQEFPWLNDSTVYISMIVNALKQASRTTNNPLIIINLLGVSAADSMDWQQFINQQVIFLKDFSAAIEKEPAIKINKHLIYASQVTELQSSALPEKAILQGLVKTINQERPCLPSVLICIGVQPDWHSIVAKVPYCITSTHILIAQRGYSLFHEHFAEIQAVKINTQSRSDIKPHIVIIGGAGQVGRQYIQGIKQISTPKLSLVQRRNIDQLLESKTDNSLLQTLANDADCQFIQGDVGNIDSLRSALEQAIKQFGPIDQLIHTAGIDASMHYRLMQDIDESFIQTCFHAKREGLLAIEKLCDEYAISKVHVISSISSILAGLGMYIYAGLHTYIDSFIQKMNQSTSTRWSAINWEAWEFGNTDEEPDTFQQGAFGDHLDSLAMPVSEGRKLIEQWINQPYYNLIVASGDLNHRYKNWVEKRELGTRSISLKDERPNLSVTYVKPTDDTMKKLADIWSDILGLDGIGIHDNFFELGGHSLMALQLVSQISKAFEQAISIVDLFAYPTIAKLSEKLGGQNSSTDIDSAILQRAEARKKASDKRRQFKCRR